MSRGAGGARGAGAGAGAAGGALDAKAMRALVRQYADLGQWSGALFWADKVFALRGASAGNDVWLVAQSMTTRGEWHRALHAITSRNLHKTHLLCLQAAARALLAAKEPAQGLQLIVDVEPELLEHTLSEIPQNRALAGVYVCKGVALSALERRGAAVESFIQALRLDVCCYEALDLLLEHQAHTLEQDRALLDSLPFDSQCGPAEAALLREVYRARTDRYGSDQTEHKIKDDTPWEPSLQLIRTHSMDVVASRARQLLHRCEFAQCLKLLDTADPWCCAELRVACLVELGNAPSLFAFAHTLVDRYPHSATAWFAVGCYYFLIGKNEFARRYLAKAKSLEPGMGCVWLAYGHSFAADNEHDQAMAAYFKASQLLPGCHLPFLYISVECSLLNNAGMAERFLARAAGLDPPQHNTHLSLCSDNEKEEERFELSALAQGDCAARLDPHITHEAGAAAFAVGKYRDAELLFKRALTDVQNAYNGDVPARWHALLDNLGHACRKNCKYDEALTYHERALACRPGHSATYAAMGFCLALMGQTERAVDVFHAALAKEPDDAVSLSMLNYLIEQLMYAAPDDDIPHFAFPSVSLDLPRPGEDSGAGEEGEGEGAGSRSCRSLRQQEVDLTNHSDMSMSFD